MKIAICDDLIDERSGLISMLEEFRRDKELEFSYCEFANGEELLKSYIPGAYALIFLDVYMEGRTGIDTARELKTIDPRCILIFTTTSREHGAEAFDLDAFHYLVKPIVNEKLFSVMNRWYDILCEIRTITIKCNRNEREVLIRDIIYIEVQGRSCTVHTLNEAIQTATALSAIEEQLPRGEFMRPIRYCLAAYKYITGVGEDTLMMTDGTPLPISRRERECIRQRLAAYRLRILRRG